MKSSRRHPHAKYLAALAGAVLAQGAPLGWLAWRSLSANPDWLAGELAAFGAVYLYMMVGTTIAFTTFGFFLGARGDEAVDEAVEAKEELHHVHELALTDGLTGLFNARHLHEHLATQMELAKRYEVPLACAMIDIDGFKAINDTHGHPFGDFVLETLARTLGRFVRRVDTVGRLGGEEFLVIMPHTDGPSARMIAERIRAAVEDTAFSANGDSAPVTVSIGVAAFPGPAVRDKSTLLKAADDALYEAKRSGKNRTVLFPPHPAI